MLRATLADAKASIDLGPSVGIAPCDSRFTPLLNNAQRWLADKGKWWGTYARVYVCVEDGCITWPRDVANIEAFRYARHGVTILNGWYEFNEAVRGPDLDDSCGPDMLIDRPSTPQFRAATGAGRIRLYPSVASDAGKKVLLQGIDASTGNVIRTQNGSIWVTGEYVTLTNPFATSTFSFAAPGLAGVQKPNTNGTVSAFSVNVETGAELKIAEWGASERNPYYRRSYLTGFCSPPASLLETDCDEGNGCVDKPTCGGTTAEAIARLELIEASVDTDWLLIPNLYALKCGMKALVKQDQNDYQQAEIETQNALRSLRAELEKYSPKRQVRVSSRPNGSATNRRVFAGFI